MSYSYNRRSPSTRDLWGFVAFSHGWTWAFWGVAAVLAAPSIWDAPASLVFYAGGAGVLLGGLVLTGITGGRAGLADLLRRTVDPRGIPLGWLAVAALLFPALTLLAAGLAWGSGATPAPLDLPAAGRRLLDPASLLPFALFILVVGPLPEEIGWRGYLLDRLQLRWNALTSTLLLALLWWSWHLPLPHLPGYFDAFARDAPGPLEVLAGILPAALLYTWVYNNTGRSVLAVILLHFMQNFTGEFLGMAPEVRPIRLALEWGTALAVLLATDPRTLRRPPR